MMLTIAMKTNERGWNVAGLRRALSSLYRHTLSARLEASRSRSNLIGHVGGAVEPQISMEPRYELGHCTAGRKSLFGYRHERK